MGTVLKFIIFLLIWAGTVALNSIYWSDIQARLSGETNWFWHVTTNSAPLPIADFGLLLLCIIGLVAFFRLLNHWIKGQSFEFSVVFRLITVVLALVGVCYGWSVKTTHDMAWKLQNEVVIKKLPELHVGMALSAVSQLLMSYHTERSRPTLEVEKTGQRQFFGRNHSFGGLDSYETYQIEVNYSLEGKLKTARYKHRVMLDAPQTCEVVWEIPTQKNQKYPYLCSEKSE